MNKALNYKGYKVRPSFFTENGKNCMMYGVFSCDYLLVLCDTIKECKKWINERISLNNI